MHYAWWFMYYFVLNYSTFIFLLYFIYGLTPLKNSIYLTNTKVAIIPGTSYI